MRKKMGFLSIFTAIGSLFLLSVPSKNVQAAVSMPTPQSSSSLPSTIDLKDNTDEEIRNYYQSFSSLSEEERTGTNILKNLKPILQNFTYYSYDNVWKVYEITDREWELSPASGTTYGTYHSDTNTITGYQYGSSSSPKNDPYVHTLYRNRDAEGVTVEAGRIKNWGDHNGTANATNKEHVWPQSRGFKASSGATGPAGTDVHHLMSGDAYVNQQPHNNNPYGYVSPSGIDKDAKNKAPYLAGNLSGTPKNRHSQDQGSVVFEPQDSDKGDIARACFYMVACYNNLSGTDTITQYNPNLELVDYVTDAGSSESSSATHAVSIGILSDLLDWHRKDPVDEYEIHRNNLIFNNYQHNRNPFIDFPQWVEYIWGDLKGEVSADPLTDGINGESVSISSQNKSMVIGEQFDLKIIAPANATVSWSVLPTDVVSLSSTSGLTTKVTASKQGNATITASVNIPGESVIQKTCIVTVTEAQALPDWKTEVSISEQTHTTSGNAFQLTISSAPPSSTITWSTSLNGVVQLSATTGASVTVTPLKNGVVTVMATITSGSESVSKSCVVTVSDLPDPPSWGSEVSISKETHTTSGSSFDLNVSNTPTASTITWSASPEGMVQLSATTGASVTITPLKNGVVTVTATITSGGKSVLKTCTITISNLTAPSTPPSSKPSVELNFSTKELKIGQSFDLRATINGTTSVDWLFEGSNFLEIIENNDGSLTITGKQAGTAKVTATIEVGGVSYSAVCEVTVLKATPEKDNKEEGSQDQQNFRIMIWVVIGLAVVLILVIVGIVIGCSKKRKKSA